MNEYQGAVRDVPVLVKRIREQIEDSLHGTGPLPEYAADIEFDDARDACEWLEYLLAEIERLREALEPFADMAALWHAGVMFLPSPDDHHVSVPYGKLRAARVALEASEIIKIGEDH